MSDIFRKYTKSELLEEFEKLRSNTLTLKRSNVGYKCSNKFFQKERFNCSSWNHVTTVEYWKKNKDRLEEMSKKYNRDIFGIIQFMNHTPSQFPPNIAQYLYKFFGATSVLDPFAGWGDRCLAAMTCDVNYTGIDCNRKLKKCYREMIEFYKPYSNKKYKFINKNIEDVDISQIVFDFVFTSPPFWDNDGVLVENYKNMKVNTYDCFMNDIFIPLLHKCRERANWSCFYIPDNMAIYLKKYGLKWNKILKYSNMGNKKFQEYKIYCYEGI